MQRLRITSAGIQTHLYSSAILPVSWHPDYTRSSFYSSTILPVSEHPGHTQFGFLHTVEAGGFRDTDMVKLHAYDRI